MLQRVDISDARLDDYRPIIGDAAAAELERLAAGLRGARIVHVNATTYGGGVSELLRSSVAIERALGLDVQWQVISGSGQFFGVTKGFHNALQGANYNLTSEARETWLLQNRFNADQLERDFDYVIVHDPQPAALLVQHGRDNAKWVWRCHIDTSNPNAEVLEFLLPFIQAYDVLVFTMPEFVPRALQHRSISIIPPAIDPLSPKNFEVTNDQCRRMMAWIGIEPDRPVMTQVSRFDPWKDPMGVIRVYREARKEVPGLQLALLGSMALDDPEAWSLLQQIQSETVGDNDITVATNLSGVGNMEVNVFQRKSEVVVQKSIREGFGLIVSETLWKGTPVVAGNTGGIPMQMPDGAGGYLVDPHDDAAFADRVVHLLRHPEESRQIGARGREVVHDHFLITRLVADELRLLLSVTGDG